MSKINLTDLSTITGNETSAINTINANNALLETASDNTLSRDGSTPNHMLDDLDMNSRSILNLPTPTTAAEPLRLQDLSDFIGTGTITAGAPFNASYLTLGTNATLTNERVLTAGTNLSFVDGGAGSTLTVNASGSGDVVGPASATTTAIAKFNGATGKLIQNTGVLIDGSNNTVPATNDTGALGTTSLKWSDLFLASGGVINWNAGDVTITHSSNALAFGGASNGYTFDNSYGYTTGSGSTVTQSTSKNTAVTINSLCGDITMNNSSLAAGTINAMSVTNSFVAGTDTVVVSHVSGGTLGSYSLEATAPGFGNGGFIVYIRNNTAGALGEAVVVRFTVIKGATS